MAYNPVKAHEYYERTKKLKGRKKGAERAKNGRSVGVKSSNPTFSSGTKDSAERVNRLKAKVATLEKALSAAQAALSKKRQDARKTKKDNSDGKSSEKEKRTSKEYRDKHKQEIATKRKKDKSSSSGSSSSSSTSISDMSADELESRIIKIRSALTDAKRQLSNASRTLGHMAHSDLASEPSFNEHYARFRSAERIPSK